MSRSYAFPQKRWPRARQLLASLGLTTALLQSVQVTAQPFQPSTETGLQNSGTECVRNINYETASINRTAASGFRAVASGGVEVICPIMLPAADSYASSEPLINLEVHFTVAAPNWCSVTHRSTNSSIYFSPYLTQTTGSTSGTSVFKLAGSYTPNTASELASASLNCALPTNSRILGYTARHGVHRVEGGI